MIVSGLLGCSPAPSIDQAALARMKANAELLPLFIEEIAGLLAIMRAALARGDAEVLKQAAHTLKGSSSYLGAARLAALSAELVQCGRSGTLEEAGPLLTQMEQEFAQVRQATSHSKLHSIPQHCRQAGLEIFLGRSPRGDADPHRRLPLPDRAAAPAYVIGLYRGDHLARGVGIAE
jgi:HPt (histidine-containing phosphotransfer) domain-containing protein